jgi:hypothetical protein
VTANLISAASFKAFTPAFWKWMNDHLPLLADAIITSLNDSVMKWMIGG